METPSPHLPIHRPPRGRCISLQKNAANFLKALFYTNCEFDELNWCMLRQSQSEELMAKSDLREWAVKGAEQRLVELAEEARAIFAAFPELRGQARGFDVKRGVL